MLRPRDEARLEPLHRTRQLDLRHPFDEVSEQRLDLEPRELRAYAEVLADPECEVQVRASVETEAEGLVEHVLVAIPRAVEEDELFAFLELLSA